MSEAAAILGRKGGSVSSARKTAAVRANAKLGGRPVRLHTLAGETVHADAELAGHLTDGRPAFVGTTPTAARWLARHGYMWGVWPFRGEPIRDLPRGGAWAKDGAVRPDGAPRIRR